MPTRLMACLDQMTRMVLQVLHRNPVALQADPLLQVLLRALRQGRDPRGFYKVSWQENGCALS